MNKEKALCLFAHFQAPTHPSFHSTACWGLLPVRPCRVLGGNTTTTGVSALQLWPSCSWTWSSTPDVHVRPLTPPFITASWTLSTRFHDDTSNLMCEISQVIIPSDCLLFGHDTTILSGIQAQRLAVIFDFNLSINHMHPITKQVSHSFTNSNQSSPATSITYPGLGSYHFIPRLLLAIAA